MSHRTCRVCGDHYTTAGYVFCEKCKRLKRSKFSDVQICERHMLAFPERAAWYAEQREKHIDQQRKRMEFGDFSLIYEAEINAFRQHLKPVFRVNEHGNKVKRFRCHGCGALLTKQKCKLCEDKITGVYGRQI